MLGLYILLIYVTAYIAFVTGWIGTGVTYISLQQGYHSRKMFLQKCSNWLETYRNAIKSVCLWNDIFWTYVILVSFPIWPPE